MSYNIKVLKGQGTFIYSMNERRGTLDPLALNDVGRVFPFLATVFTLHYDSGPILNHNVRKTGLLYSFYIIIPK